MKRIVLVLMSICTLILLLGCSRQTPSAPSVLPEVTESVVSAAPTESIKNTIDAATEAPVKEKPIEAPPFTIDDIEIEVEQKISEGERILVSRFTNNSDYILVGVMQKLVLKDGITKDDVNEQYNYSEYANLDDWEDWDESDIYMNVWFGRMFISEDSELLMQSKTSEDTPLVLSNYYGVYEYSEYENMEPDMATIAYLDKDYDPDNADEEIKVMYYDYKSQKYSFD